jgi:hypothetical protein
LFESEDRDTYAVYSIAPHRVLQFSLASNPDIAFEEVSRVEWSLQNYPPSHGGLRGGSPPCHADGRFWSFCHSVHDGANGYRYAAAAYSFGGRAPFSPLTQPAQPLELGNPFGENRTHARLNPAVGEVIYPCGAARDDTRWLISHGINDEYCAISLVPHGLVLDTQRPITAAGV